MKQVWSIDELGECWTLSADEFALVERRRQPDGRLGIAHQIKHYQLYAQFLDSDRDIPADITEYLIDQIGDGAAKLDVYDWGGRSGRRHRLEVLKFLGVPPFDDAADTKLRAWLIDETLPLAPSVGSLSDQITTWFLGNRVERPDSNQLE